MLESVEGVIIREKTYSETSKIIDIITKKYGVISVMAKGAKTLKSKNRSSTSKLIYGIFNIVYKENKLSTLMEVDVLNYYKNIKKDIIKISYASYILELVEQVLKQNTNEEIYNNLIFSLDKIESNLNPLVITNILEFKCLDFLGVMPIISECAVCGSKSVITISSDKGGFLCKDCRKSETIVDEKTIKLIRMFYFIDIGKVDKIDVSKRVVDEVNHFLTAYYERYTGLYLKSKKFIEELESVGVV